MTFYRSFNNIKKGGNLTIYCFLRQLEAWRERHDGKFPEQIYFQVDGGSENANKYVLAFLEYLVSRRITRKVVYSRLPTGHTHEDIDACFAQLWKWLRGRPILTVADFKVGVEKAFGASRLRASVEDIYCIPDYCDWFERERCIDTKLSNYTKQKYTQHQWCFEAVQGSQYFPFGCRTKYRAYCSDTVIEIIKKPFAEALTPVGQITGLKAVKTYVK